MKKTFYLIFVFILISILQFFFGNYLSLWGGYPNFILIAIVYLGITRGRLDAAIAGFLFGIVWDVFSTDVFGMRMLLFSTTGYFIGVLSKTIDTDQPYSQTIIMVFASIIYFLGISVILFLFSDGRETLLQAIFNWKNFICFFATVIVAIPALLFLKIINRYLKER
ncbi:MAG: rod shape-determining protein MreD [Elusimicrobiota bacterium]|nr:rod shape-determining protein MreD [Elusimicrobiota bacterium]